MIYSFNFGDFESGKFVATRHPDNRAVGGDWVIVAPNDAAALEAAWRAADEEWSAPETRRPEDFSVEFDGHDPLTIEQAVIARAPNGSR